MFMMDFLAAHRTSEKRDGDEVEDVARKGVGAQWWVLFYFLFDIFPTPENCVKSAETTMQQAEDKIGILSKIDLLKKTESKDMKNYGVQLEVGILSFSIFFKFAERQTAICTFGDCSQSTEGRLEVDRRRCRTE